MPPGPRTLRTLCATAAAALSTALLAVLTAPASATTPVDAAKALAAPGVPGANDWSCRPTTAHPRPVVLVHGTFANGSVNWITDAPALAARGYCVFALTYGQVPGVPVLRAVAPVAESAAQLATFVTGVLAATNADQVDVVGHSQGGMMPRYYLRFLGGAAQVHALVGLAPSNHGTTLDGLAALAASFPGAIDLLNAGCPACGDQIVGSDLLTRLNAGGDTVPGVSYTVISTKYDEVVTPYGTQFLSGSGVRNVTLQDLCPADLSEHAAMAFDPVVLHEVENALDPAHATTTTCASHG
ncbi:lipase family protein [Actinoallomurus purpureus]|uniref:esterase/lipase family protein n=1 Tax=Actinoallomurus purpureus TaxID=478114 RepID=UPI002093B8DC|nr:alpha/beta fold hydrolase [Actinoallomurus purpureus]MCO6008884.1 lipase family protein [Actinoallomurus purpureus]